MINDSVSDWRRTNKPQDRRKKLREDMLNFNWAAASVLCTVKGNRNNRNNWQLDTIIQLPMLSAFESQIAPRYQNREGETLKTFGVGHSKGYNTAERHVTTNTAIFPDLPSPPRSCRSSHEIVSIARISSSTRSYLRVSTAVPSMWQHSPSFSYPDRLSSLLRRELSISSIRRMNNCSWFHRYTDFLCNKLQIK